MSDILRTEIKISDALSSVIYKAALAGLFAYFLLRLAFFALSINPYIPPDESTHFAKCMIYSKHAFIPPNGSDTFRYGLVTNIPYLYYFLMGKMLHLNIFNIHNLVFLRLINVLLCMLTLSFAYRWFLLLTSNRIAHVCFVALLTNTLMFTFTSSFVSYDNLTNLFAAASLFYLFKLFSSGKPTYLIALAISLLGGTLTKVSFLPFALIIVIVVIYHHKRDLRSLGVMISGLLHPVRVANLISVSAALALLCLAIGLYGVNVVRYGKIEPSCTDVLAEDECMEHRLYARSNVLSRYKNGEYDYEEARAAALEIRHPGDRADAVALLDISKRIKEGEVRFAGPVEYAFIWISLMTQRTFGIAAHLVMTKSAREFYVYILIGIVCAAIIIRKWTFSKWQLNYSFCIFISYVLILMYYVNYRIYLGTAAPGLALTGRYIFPVLFPLYGLAAYFFTCFKRASINLVFTILLSSYFIDGDMPFFLAHATPAWFSVPW